MRKLICPNFVLGETLTTEQFDYFDKNGVIIFRNFAGLEAVNLFLTEIRQIEARWLGEGREKVNGIPLKFSKNTAGEKMIQRMCFLSQHSSVLHELLQDPRMQSLLQLLYPYEGRIGENEKDGLVFNHYIKIKDSSFTKMGWHTDSPRDLFLGQKIMPMLNVGIHLNDCPMENGGLRVLPGTHKQGMLKLLFAKKYFIDNNPDAKEFGLDIKAGDLTVHDGRIWHRAQESPYMGEQSRRRVMYVPIITGRVTTKHEKSKTPFYHKLASRVQT